MAYQTAFITGAAGGLGSALARDLARRGVEVVLCDVRREPLESLAQSIQAGGGRARSCVLDVTQPDEVRRAMCSADDATGGIDLIIANAGTNVERWSGALTWEDYRAGAAVNLDGAVATLLALLPRLCERKRGHLVGISSLAQYRGLPGNAMYSATKAFLSRFLESLRVDLRSAGVAVTDVRPGFVDTPMTEAASGPHPFLLTPERAAKIIVSGVVAHRAVVAFPWQLAFVSRCGLLLPPRLYEWVVSSARAQRPPLAAGDEVKKT